MVLSAPQVQEVSNYILNKSNYFCFQSDDQYYLQGIQSAFTLFWKMIYYLMQLMASV